MRDIIEPTVSLVRHRDLHLSSEDVLKELFNSIQNQVAVVSPSLLPNLLPLILPLYRPRSTVQTLELHLQLFFELIERSIVPTLVTPGVCRLTVVMMARSALLPLTFSHFHFSDPPKACCARFIARPQARPS